MANEIPLRPIVDIEEQVRELFQKWEFLVTNQGYSFDVEYYENHFVSGKMLDSSYVTMQCWNNWQHKHARIAVNLESMKGESVRPEWIVVHELVHILLGECEYPDEAMEERACSEIASAILQVSVQFNKNK